MEIGDRIKNRRLELHMTAEELAKKIGVHMTTIYRYESNDIEKMPITILKPLADALETTPADLMGWEIPQKDAEMIDVYNRAKSSDKAAIKVLVGAIDKLLNIDEPKIGE